MFTCEYMKERVKEKYELFTFPCKEKMRKKRHRKISLSIKREEVEKEEEEDKKI
jgi:hypothetical protein